ncbi:MAG: hypothetical protein IJT30_02220 [Muribaculaceae bacterium]|nr:hypothetical protein [Muribaculaceae bacterium]
MNRQLLHLLVMLFALAAWSVAVAQPRQAPYNPYMPGDVNDDRVVDIDDVNSIINQMVHKQELTGRAWNHADCNRDSVIDVDDLNAVINHMMRKDLHHVQPLTLVVELRDGTRTVTPLADQPVIKFDRGNLVVRSRYETWHHSMEKLYRVYFANESHLQKLARKTAETKADNANPYAIFVYRNDGDFNAFVHQDIDSIQFSTLGTDSLWYDNAIVQEVWTTDNVYRIPLAGIDSLTFQAPRPELRDDLYHITAAHLPWIVASTDSTLVFLANTPTTMLPAIGQTVISDVHQSPLELGFSGVVDTLATLPGGNVLVSCSEARVGDVFKQILIAGRSETTDDANAPQLAPGRIDRRRSVLNDVWSFMTDGYQGEPFYFQIPILPLEVGNVFEITSKKPKVTVAWWVRIDPFTYNAHADVFLQHNDIEWSFTLGSNIAENEKQIVDFLNNEQKKEDEHWLDPKWRYDVVPGIVVIKFGPYIGKPEGEFSLEGGVREMKVHQRISFSAGGLTATALTSLPMVTPDLKQCYSEVIDQGKPHLGIYLKGSIKAGFYVKPVLQLFSEKVSASVNLETGLKLSGQAGVTLDDLLQSGQWRWFEALKDVSVGLKWYADLKTKATIFDLDLLTASSTFPLAEADLCTFYAFPGLTTPYPNPDDPNILLMKPEHNCPIPMKLGMKLYDSQNNEIRHVLSTNKYWWEKSWNLNQLQMPISSLTPGTTYTCRPTVMASLFGKEWEQEATTCDYTFTVPGGVSVKTATVSKASYLPLNHPDAYEFNGVKHTCKYWVQATPSIPDPDKVEAWGVIYVGADGVTQVQYSCNGKPATAAVTIPIVADVPSHTLKICAYATYKTTHETVTGEWQEFALAYPDNISLELNDVTFSGTTQDVTYNGQIYKYKSSFRFVCTVGGAYWQQVSTLGEGNGWASLPASPQRIVRPADGPNVITMNYYYNNALSGDFIVRLQTTDTTHNTGLCTLGWAEYLHNSTVFTGCTYHSGTSAAPALQAPAMQGPIYDNGEINIIIP